MKKSIFITIALFCAAGSALAMTPGSKLREGPTLANKMANDGRVLQDKSYMDNIRGHIPATRADEENSVIYFPEGIEKPYTKSIIGLDWGESFQENSCTAIVFGENNEIYIRDIILRAASLGFSSYVKGEINGSVISVPVPQMVVEYEGGWGREVALMEKTADNDWVVSDLPAISFSYNEATGVITSNLPGTPGQYAIGLKWSFDDSWNEIGDFIQVYTPYDGEFVTVPEDVDLEEYYYLDGTYAYSVKVGYQGNDLYIVGLSEALPNAVVKAEMNGDKGYIPQNELISTTMGYFVWTKMMVPDPVLGWALVADTENYLLDIDLENKIIKSADPEQILILNCEYNRVFYLDGFVDFSLTVPTSYAGTPQNPYGIVFDGEEFREFYGVYGFTFNISNISKEGTILRTQDLYYSIFIDGDILEFEENEGLYGYMYPNVEGIVTRMPFDFSNGYDIDAKSETERFIGIYPDGVTTIGVQAIYEYEGQTTFSDIVTLNVENNQISDSGVEVIRADDIQEVSYFDLQGRKIAHPQKGMYIAKYLLKDGKTVSKKVWIKSL